MRRAHLGGAVYDVIITAGNISSEVFIENGRLHGPKVIRHIVSGMPSERG